MIDWETSAERDSYDQEREEASMTDATDSTAPTIHALRWAQTIANELSRPECQEQYWRAIPIDKSEAETYASTRCYLLGYQANPAKAKLAPTVKLFVSTWGDTPGTASEGNDYRVSCPDAPLGVPSCSFRATDHAITVAKTLLDKVIPGARAARARVLAASASMPLPGQERTPTAADVSFRPSDLAALQQAYPQPAPQETLASEVRKITDELDRLIEADDRMANFFFDPTTGAPRLSYAAHHKGRAEGYAYVQKRLLAVLRDSSRDYGVRLTDKGRQIVEASREAGR